MEQVQNWGEPWRDERGLKAEKLGKLLRLPLLGVAGLHEEWYDVGG
jgi:hypothetical protein